MQNTISTQQLLDGLLEGRVDLSTLSLKEFLEISFLHAMSSNVININNKVMYGGNLFNIHCCVEGIEALPDAVKGLKVTQ